MGCAHRWREKKTKDCWVVADTDTAISTSNCPLLYCLNCYLWPWTDSSQCFWIRFRFALIDIPKGMFWTSISALQSGRIDRASGLTGRQGGCGWSFRPRQARLRVWTRQRKNRRVASASKSRPNMSVNGDVNMIREGQCEGDAKAIADNGHKTKTLNANTSVASGHRTCIAALIAGYKSSCQSQTNPWPSRNTPESRKPTKHEAWISART